MDNTQRINQIRAKAGLPPVGGGVSSSPNQDRINEIRAKAGLSPIGGSSSMQTTVEKTNFALVPKKWETGMDDSVDRSGLGNVATGVAKTLVRTPVNLLQAITPDKMFGENSLLNSESQKAQDFAEATRREGKTQRVAGGLTDIGLAFVPGGAVSKVGKATELASMAGLARTVPKVLEGTNALSKFTRFAPKIAGNVAEGVVGSAVMRGPDDKQNLVSDIAWGVATPTVLAGFKYLPKLFGKELSIAKRAEEIANNTKNDPATVGRFLTAEKANLENLKNEIKRLPEESKFSKWVESKKNQLTNLDYISPEEDVTNVMSLYGGPRSLQQNGKYSTEQIVKTIAGDKQKIADASDNFVKSSNVKIPTTEVANFSNKTDSIIDSLPFDEIEKDALKIEAQKSLERQFAGKKFITPDDMNQYSKSLRNQAYDADKVLDTKKARYSRAIARVMDDTLQQTLDTQGKTYFKEFKKMYTLLDAAENGWKGFAKIKPEGKLGQGFVNMGGAIGAISGGFGPQGIIFGMAGREGSKSLAKLINKIAVERNSPELFNSIKTLQQGKNLQDFMDGMEKIVASNVSSAQKEKNLAEYLKKKAAQKMKTRAYKEAQNKEFEMPDIQMGVKPKRDLSGMIEMENSPNVYGSKAAETLRKMSEMGPDIRF